METVVKTSVTLESRNNRHQRIFKFKGEGYSNQNLDRRTPQSLFSVTTISPFYIVSLNFWLKSTC